MSEHDEQVAVVEYCELKGIPCIKVLCDAYGMINPERGQIMEIGEKYNRLTVVEFLPDYKARFICECGNEVIALKSRVKTGETKSCGCYKRDIQRERMIQRNTTHGKGRTRLYRIWYGMNRRCSNPKFKQFKDYGGRGIKVCGEWRRDFMAFYDWAMANGYDEALTLDRIDNDGNYTPSNCRWITRLEQMQNTRSARMISFNGKTLSLTEWSRETGIKRDTIRQRMDRLGWSVEDALTKEVAKV